MKKSISALLAIVLLLCSVCALASFNQDLIGDAKQALTLMSYGEYKKALKKLDLKGKTRAKDLAAFVEEELFDILSASVQSDVAVAFLKDEVWYVAVPVEPPSYDGVQTFVLRSKDGARFDTFKKMDWYEVESMMDLSTQIIWQDAYEDGRLYAVPDAR
ncbi:MAG: hypothetical protein ACOYI7_01040 [Candidatus Excrementavichristensenella sp.]|jgi:hypothetical protein